jgi:pyridoxine kinase
MARILTISSQVVRGHVGLSAIVPALQRLGHEVLAVPTIVLSNHPGHMRAAGTRIEVNTLVSMLDVLDANGWLADIDAILTGYLPTPEHVHFAGRAIDLVRERSKNPVVLVDPVMGDDPRGLYIDVNAAAAIRDDLVHRAALLTPNRFELSWLSGDDVRTCADAVAAASKLKVPRVLATSIPDGPDVLANVSAESGHALVCRVGRKTKVPHGTGDLLSGLLMGHVLINGNPRDALGRAVAGVQSAIEASAGRSDLRLAIADGGADWSLAAPMLVEAM